MNTQTDRYPFRVPFTVKGNATTVAYYSNEGVIIEVDPTCKYACACFDNLQDMNNFKEYSLACF